MSAYETLAASYDRLTNDVDYAAVADFVEKILQREGVQPSSVLDLCCGTGSLSMVLAQRGYRVIGVDASADMLAVAFNKALELPEEKRAFFVCQLAQKLKLPEKVDLTVCGLDSLNYLVRPKDCAAAVRRVWRNLNHGGLFIFDLNTPAKLRSMDGQVFLDEDDDVYCVWRGEYDADKRICSYGIDLFQRQGTHWVRSFEEHQEYAYSIAQMMDFLLDAGFSGIKVYGDRRLEAPQEGEQRIYFVAKKE
jgi:SAM-dependent methyltransferase